MGITSDYVDFCLDLTYDDLPLDVIAHVKQLALDFIGTAAYGTLDQTSKVMLTFIESLNVRGECTIMGAPFKCVPQYAALANGTFVKAHELDDVEESGGLHPGPSLWPVILAVGEKYHLDGKKLITAVTLGYETGVRLGQASNREEQIKRGFHPTATCGHFGATVTASKLLDLDKQQTINALGITGSQVSGSFRYTVAGAWTKNFHSGWAAHNGILAALLAQKGFNGPTAIFEGQYGFLYSYSQDSHPEFILKDLGKVFQTTRVGVKIHSACTAEHTGIDAVLAIVREHDLLPEDIQRVDIYLSKNALTVVVEPEDRKRAPQNLGEANHSMYYGAAIAIIKRRAFIEEHNESWLHSLQVKDLISKIYCHELLPGNYATTAMIQTKDGRKFEQTVTNRYGSYLNPVPFDELREKYHTLARSIYSEKRVQQIEDAVMHLEEIHHINGVVNLLSRK